MKRKLDNSLAILVSLFGFVLFLGCSTPAPLPVPQPLLPTPIFSSPTPMPPPPTAAITKTPFPPTPTPSPKVVRIVETIPTRLEILEVSKIPARNCVGTNPVRIQETVSKSTMVEVTVGTNAGLDMKVKAEAGINIFGISAVMGAEIAASVQKHYHVATGTQLTKSVSFEVEARPGTYFEYPVFWKEVWSEGYAVVENWDGSQFTVPFSVKRSLQGEILDGINVGCK